MAISALARRTSPESIEVETYNGSQSDKSIRVSSPLRPTSSVLFFLRPAVKIKGKEKNTKKKKKILLVEMKR